MRERWNCYGNIEMYAQRRRKLSREEFQGFLIIRSPINANKMRRKKRITQH